MLWILLIYCKDLDILFMLFRTKWHQIQVIQAFWMNICYLEPKDTKFSQHRNFRRISVIENQKISNSANTGILGEFLLFRTKRYQIQPTHAFWANICDLEPKDTKFSQNRYFRRISVIQNQKTSNSANTGKERFRIHSFLS